MKLRLAIVIYLSFPFHLLFADNHSMLPQIKTGQYPESPRGRVAETQFGVEVADPYRWLEEIDSEQSQAWVKAQAEFTDQYLAKLPGRERIRKRLEEMWDFDKFGIPRKVKGNKLIYSRRTGLQNQSVLYWRLDEPDSEESVLLDPNTFSEDGTIALSSTRVSHDGKIMAYGISKSGSDWQEWKFREIETGKDLEDHIEWIKFAGCSWAPDDKSVLYSRYDEPEEGETFKAENYYQKVYRHVIGTDQSEDQLIYQRSDQKDWGFNAGYTEDGNYIILWVRNGAGAQNGLFYQDLTKGDDSPFVELFNEFDSRYSVVGNEGDLFYLHTDRDADQSKVVAIDLKNPEPENWQEIIPEHPKKNLRSVSYLAGKFICEYLVDVREEVEVFDRKGQSLGPIELPNFGTVYGFSGDQNDTETFYMVTGFTTPGSIYRYDVEKQESTFYIEPKLAFEVDDYETEQVFFNSKDGTRIPMYLTYRKGLKRDGQNPTILYGYGGFNISLGPSFSISRIAWMELGGVYAQVNLRGGGEYGEAWHEAGMRLKKQNVFDDFIGAAEYLITEKITSTPKLAISGGSNGGLLVAACLNQRPELFGAALPSVGVHDMLRFQKFTIGWAWQKEYGFPEENEADFKNLLSYSPVHQTIKGTQFPPVLVETADHDDRVFPAHSFKYAAQLQHAQAATEPVLIRIETKAGHGAGKPTSKIIDELADSYAFLFGALGMEHDE